MSAIRKRFIAGAVCPDCNAMDTLAVWHEEHTERVECIQCGYHQRQVDQQEDKSVRHPGQVIGMFNPE